jgi:hypothetical protein
VILPAAATGLDPHPARITHYLTLWTTRTARGLRKCPDGGMTHSTTGLRSDQVGPETRNRHPDGTPEGSGLAVNRGKIPRDYTRDDVSWLLSLAQNAVDPLSRADMTNDPRVTRREGRWGSECRGMKAGPSRREPGRPAVKRACPLKLSFAGSGEPAMKYLHAAALLHLALAYGLRPFQQVLRFNVPLGEFEQRRVVLDHLGQGRAVGSVVVLPD